MSVTVIKSNDFRATASDEFFFDNNVWFYLYCPIANAKLNKQQKYSSILSAILSLKRPIFINSLVLSEFTNAWLRLEFKNWANGNLALNFKKDFVKSPAYANAAGQIQTAIEQILKITVKGNDDFNAISVEMLMKSLKTKDFNDSYYLQLAERKKWKIVTDDSDMFVDNDYNITVVTA